MSSFSIHPKTGIGTIALNVSDLSRAERFYRDILGFTSNGTNGLQRTLTAGGSVPLVNIHSIHDAPPKSPRTSGLYHFCVLVPHRADLAHLLRRIVESRTPVQGLVDHHFSESIYLADPDGNGIELSCDRHRDVWKSWDVFLRLGNAPLDVEGLEKEIPSRNSTWTGLTGGTTIGHIHLHVADLDIAEEFYHGVLGFDLMAEIPNNVRFVSAGGYHHHVAYNLWAGKGAPPAPAGSIGLNRFTITIPDRVAMDTVIERIRKSGINIHDAGALRTLRDPFDNTIVLAEDAGTG